MSSELLDENIIERIQKIYNDCTKEEQAILYQIVEEYADFGYSTTYDNVWLADYKEIPVDKTTFLTDNYFLGLTNNQGKSIYPIWMKTMQDLESAGNQYYEIVLTGATRTGKTSTAVSDAAYQLYRLMCLRNPQEYFSLKDVTTISIFFFNLTATLARGVAFKEFNSTLAASPWFMEHGHMTKSEANPTYVPEGGLIEVSYGSDASHALGKATFCLVGTTEILTDQGVRSLAELADSKANVAQVDPNGEVVYSDALVACTGLADKTIRVELEDGSVFEGTADHKVMLADSTYTCLSDLQEGDDIFNLEARELKVSKIATIEYNTPILVYDVIDAKPNHNFIVCTEHSNIVAHNCVVFDEVNFAQAGIKDVAKSKKRMKEKYDTLVARVTGTFVKHGEVFGKLYVISSKRSDSDFMEEYVETQKAAGNKHMFVFDRPQWEVWPASKYSSDEKFWIAVGDKHAKGFVVPDEETEEGLNELRSQGYRLIQVPVDNKVRFLSDFDIALRDIAGISVPGTLSFISQDVLDSCIGVRKNPFFNEILSIGTKDSYTIEEFFHADVVDSRLKHSPMFIHLDLSLTTDKTGISGVCINGRKDIEDPDGKKISQPTFAHIFSVDIQAPRGDKIPYAKITAFLCWLRRQGFNIDHISRDQFQSEYMAQLLEAQGFKVDKLSLDRTPDGYNGLRSVLLEERIDMLDVQQLQNELIRLQRDSVTGKIDHPEGGEKDMSDSFAGAVWNAIVTEPGVPVPSKSIAAAMAAVNTRKSPTTPLLGSMMGDIYIRR